MSDPKLPEYSKFAEEALKDDLTPRPEFTFDQQFQITENIERLKNELPTEELQSIFEEVQEQEKKDVRNLTIKEFLRKLLDSFFYFLIDVFDKKENIITAATKDNRALFIGIDIIILLIFIKTFIL